MLDWSEIILRLGIATLAGGLIGLNCDLHGKPIGLKTLGLVSLATAMLLCWPIRRGHRLGRRQPGDAESDWIGFLAPASLSMRSVCSRATSAACTWLAACIGIVCGLGQWRVVIIALVITFAVLTVGGRMERALHKRLGGKDEAEQEPPPASSVDKQPTLPPV